MPGYFESIIPAANISLYQREHSLIQKQRNSIIWTQDHPRDGFTNSIHQKSNEISTFNSAYQEKQERYSIMETGEAWLEKENNK